MQQGEAGVKRFTKLTFASTTWIRHDIEKTELEIVKTERLDNKLL
jgi:hypothetical protein